MKMVLLKVTQEVLNLSLSLSLSLSLAYKNVKAQLKNRSKAIVLPFLFSDENRMMQSQRDNESIMEWNVLSSCT